MLPLPSAKEPEAHSEHFTPSEDTLPGAQAVQVEAPSIECVPGGQSEHAKAAEVVECLPAGQSRHEAAPGTSL